MGNKKYIAFNRVLKSITVANRCIAKRMLLIFFSLALSNSVFSQETSNLYVDTYTWSWLNMTSDISEKSIQHRKAKWYENRFRGELTEEQKKDDTFDEEGGGMSTMTLDNSVHLQDTHEYVDTIYMHKGTSITLDIPNYLISSDALDVSTNFYQRWFDYRTDGNFYCNFSKDDSGTIYDLLTPGNQWYANQGTEDSRFAHRFKNGYVQINQTYDYPDNLYELNFYYPTDDEYETISESGGFIKTDNEYYVVAADVSIFNDTYKEYYYEGYPFGLQEDGKTEGDFYEPTLSGRVIFYIIGVEDASDSSNLDDVPEKFRYYWNILNEEYQGGTTNENAQYLEEYDIVYPTYRTSCNTNELVTLSKDADAYAIPVGTADNDNRETVLNIDFESNDAGLALVNQTLSGQNRVIQFYKSGVTSGSPWKIDDGATSTIIVTKTVGGTTYNIARFKLTFKDKATPLTLVQVNNIGTNDAYWWNNMLYRSPQYIADNYDEITSLKFDFTTDASKVLTATSEEIQRAQNDWITPNPADGNGQKEFYPFPLDWGSTSYAFYDGSNYVDVKGAHCDSKDDILVYTRYGMYSLTNDYIGFGDRSFDGTNLNEKPSGTNDFWFYVDASDRPGQVAELRFEENLCTGSEIVGTALIKSAGSGENDDAGVLLTLMGVKIDETTEEETHVPIYCQASSQIEITTSILGDIDEDDLISSQTGKGSDTNQWFQLYFSFVNPSDEKYDYYTLKIDNYCASTDGGDYYIDDIQLYVVQPKFLVEQIAPICTSDVQASAVRLMVDFDKLEARMGDTVSEKSEDDNTDDTVSFMIIDMTKYNNYFSENAEASQENRDDIAKAIEASTVPFVYTDSNGKTQSPNYMTLKFYVDDAYSDYPIYNGKERVAGENTYDISNGHFFLYTMDGEEYLAIDCYADISPYKPYKILLLTYDISSSSDEEPFDEEDYAKYFAQCMDDKCKIASDFYLTSSTILKVNGEAVDPTVDYCAGQTVVIWPEVTYTASDDTTVTLGDEYFDWFFGTEEEYTQVNETYDVSLQDALLMFRHFYPTATELEELMKGTTDNDSNEFTQDMYEIIVYYLELENESSYHAKLVLYQQYMDVVISAETYLYLVVQPIEVITTDENGNETADICFGYVPLTLGVGGEAPTFNAGFGNVEYPGDDYVPGIRLGLEQIAKATTTSTSEATPIHVNLRNAEYASMDEESGDPLADHLGLYENMDELYLVGTDDPNYAEAISDEYFTQYTLPIGKIQNLYAIAGDTEGESYMEIEFYSEEHPLREGYSYIVIVNCEEKYENGEAVGTACQGTLPIEIKVVPEYLVWTGDETSNWNDDSNWLRAEPSQLNKPEGDPYPTNNENTTSNGLVPMLFSKVVIPEDKTAELYMAGFKANGSQFFWTGDESTTTHDDVTDSPTENIMYDLMVYDTKDDDSGETSMKTERYRVNLCRQLHLAPGAQLLHSELLIVDTVWTEVKIPQGEWQLVATPLQGVASGDWYTKRATGTETAEYFTDIYWSTSDNNRYDPDIYQRSWNKTGTIVVSTDSPTSSTDRTTPAYASTGWTSAYNDASESFTSGVGFSLEGWSSVESTDSIMFRFPKADTSYAYSTGTLDTNHGTGTLLISSLVDRSNPDEDMKDGGVYKEGGITVSLPVNTLTGNNYYLIGNPFTAPMSMGEFMAANTDIKGYWTGDDNGPVAGKGGTNSWGTDDYLLPPYSGFFVTTSESDISPVADSPLTVYFTENMQTLGVETGEVSPAPRHFAIRATNDVGTSGASLSYDDSATDGYDASEDVILLEDDSWMREGMPMVYTVAGDMAVSINTLSSATTIPIGAFADDDCAYTLTFVGLDNLIEPVLYDAYALTETPLTEGFTLDLTGASHGQYFIRVAAPTPTGITEDYTPTYDITAYSPTQGTIIVSSSATLEDIDVYSVGGMLLRQVNAGGNISCTINGINSGIAIVRAKTSEGTFVKKLRVR